MTKYLHAALAAIALMAVSASDALAFRVFPLVLDFNAVGQGSAKTITVENTGAAALPVELRVNALEVGFNGEPIKSVGGEDEFVIFPPAAIIQPGGTQVFRVQWIGDPDIKESRTYNITVAQLPVDLPGVDPANGATQVQMQIVFNMAALAMVRPLEAQASVAVSSAQVVNVEGEPRLELVVENNGSAHELMRAGEMSVEIGGWSESYNDEEMRAIFGVGLVQPGHKRRFLLALPGMPTSGSASVALDF